VTREQIIETMARAKCEREGYKPDMEYLGTGEPLWLRFEHEAAADLAALEAAGLAVVPVEQTDEMIYAAVWADQPPKATVEDALRAEWKAQIAAAQGTHKP
jgi:aspartate aminotransferase-like enzyme